MKNWIACWMMLGACSEAVAPPKPEPVAVMPQATTSRVPLGQRLADEASSRPERAVRPAQLVEALQKRGVAFARQRQVLASPLEASYCELIATNSGLSLSVCEFADGDAAERGLARSRTSFDAMLPGRTLDTRVNSLLTIAEPANPEGERQRELARATFASLTPSTR